MDEKNDIGLQRRVDKFDLYQQKSIESKYSYFRNITTISLGFLALFVSFKPEEINNICAKYLFISTTLLFGLCILFSLIATHGEVFLHQQSAISRAKILIDYKPYRKTKTSQSEFVKLKPIYKIFEKLTYFCLLVSILSLIVYVYFLVFP